jgi:hypothetical protein
MICHKDSGRRNTCFECIPESHKGAGKKICVEDICLFCEEKFVKRYEPNSKPRAMCKECENGIESRQVNFGISKKESMRLRAVKRAKSTESRWITTPKLAEKVVQCHYSTCCNCGKGFQYFIDRTTNCQSKMFRKKCFDCKPKLTESQDGKYPIQGWSFCLCCGKGSIDPITSIFDKPKSFCSKECQEKKEKIYAPYSTSSTNTSSSSSEEEASEDSSTEDEVIEEESPVEGLTSSSDEEEEEEEEKEFFEAMGEAELFCNNTPLKKVVSSKPLPLPRDDKPSLRKVANITANFYTRRLLEVVYIRAKNGHTQIKEMTFNVNKYNQQSLCDHIKEEFVEFPVVDVVCDVANEKVKVVIGWHMNLKEF